ncbi:MAG: exodeoxyribonuclease VII small subunit, partial [Oleispira sp.]
MAKTTFHFEESLAELESLVERMESGEMSLE